MVKTDRYQELLKNLEQCRQVADMSLTVMRKLSEELVQSQPYQDAENARKIAMQTAGEITEEIRKLALADYGFTKNKHPYPGIGVRIMTRLEYDAVLALHWCWENLKSAVVLDTKFFERVMKEMKLQPVPGFVTKTEQPEVTIAQDLSKVLDQIEAANEHPVQ